MRIAGELPARSHDGLGIFLPNKPDRHVFVRAHLALHPLEVDRLDARTGLGLEEPRLERNVAFLRRQGPPHTRSGCPSEQVAYRCLPYVQACGDSLQRAFLLKTQP